MHNYRNFQFGLLLLILAAFSGLIGFVIVYHYSTYERPVQHFAIVIDAGSTQTRSNLFSIHLDTAALADYSDTSTTNRSASTAEPLSKLFQVQQVDSCVNGGPLANIQSPMEARELVRKCLEKFSRRIRQLDMIKHNDGQQLGDKGQEEEEIDGWTSEDMADELAAKNRRVNSATHLYLGATAGLRALNELNQTRASEKIGWIDKAINESNTLVGVESGPYINKGYVGILEGRDEAAYGWTSVNFVCDQLKAAKPSGVDYEQAQVEQSGTSTSTTYQTPQLLPADLSSQSVERKSVGTLELGGASSQMAFELPPSEQSTKFGKDHQLHELDLFNAKYKLATRSDLCFGMSQATLRANFVLLRDHYNTTQKMINSSSAMELREPTQLKLELVNPCLQRASKMQLTTSSNIKDFLHGPCLVDAARDDFKRYLLRKSEILFVGTGNVEQCNHLLEKLIDPHKCRQYFQLCPMERNQQRPPANMPFVTISGYNKALKVLNLRRAPVSLGSGLSPMEQVIAAKLGGHSVEHQDFVQSTREFCLLDAGEFSQRYPAMNKQFYPINCLQLVYINKLLTEFYLFDPRSSWHQIKFLIFPLALPVAADGSAKLAADQRQQQQQEQDIGWTLGLLLNATSQQYNGTGGETIFHHHSSSLIFVMRATIFLMFACILLAISLIVLSMLTVRHHHRKAYISHPLEEGPPSPRL